MEKREIYCRELIKDLKEMVSDTLEAGEPSFLGAIPGSCYISQLIIGDYTALTAIYADETVLNAFAAAYAKFDIAPEERDEIIADFLNLTNGHFAVVLSNSQSVECSLSVPEFVPPGNISLNTDSIVIPVKFSFGEVNFIFSE